MHFAAMLILASTLVLRSGDRITVDGGITERDGVVIFRSGGALYSVPASEVDEKATKAANAGDSDESANRPGRLKVSAAERDRLLRELEKNHAGQPPAEQSWQREPVASAKPEAKPDDSEEWRWRREARSYEEAVRQAKENLNLLLDRREQLRDQIRGFLSLGYKPQNFTYQTTQLAYVEEAIPGAELAVQRAERAYAQFRDDARRQGIMPGWLR